MTLVTLFFDKESTEDNYVQYKKIRYVLLMTSYLIHIRHDS